MCTIRVGIVGTGFIAAYHCDCIRRVYGVDAQVAGATDVAIDRCERFAEKHGVTAYPDLDAMIEHVDVVDVCTPPYAHEKVILQAVAAGKHIICEKPLVGYAGPANDDSFRGDVAPKEPMLSAVVASLERIQETVSRSNVIFGYAENCVYAPSVQKEREIICKSRAQVLRMIGEESHAGNAASYSSFWKYSCGGSLISTGSHPLGVMLYLKRVEGDARNGKLIRPASVSARAHGLTRMPNYEDRGFLRCDYHDVEDYGWMHVTFDDGTVGDVVTGATALGGIYDYVEVFAHNHRTRCRINPVDLLDTYNPGEERFEGIYLVEKISTKQGWSSAAPDEYWTMGYQAEMQDIMKSIAAGRQPQSDLGLAMDVVNTIYSAYLSAERRGAEVEIDRKGYV